MRNRRRGIAFFSACVVALVVLTGCSALFSKMYGIRSLKQLQREEILKIAAQQDLPVEDCFELDTAFATHLKALDVARYREQINNHMQPLQVLYYTRNGEFLSYFVNCYAGGFPNLKWNLKGFVPTTQAPLDSLVSMDTQFLHFQPLASGRGGRPNPDYWVLVYWNRFMGRQSERLLDAVKKNVAESGKNAKVIYVNNDNFLYRALNAQ